jgi:hypothetical protein
VASLRNAVEGLRRCPGHAYCVHHEEAFAEVFADLEGDELDVVGYVVQGLREGKAFYGQLRVDEDGRDFRQQAIQEGRDQVIYDVADLLRRVRSGARP